MVPMTINFYTCKEEIRKSLIHSSRRLDIFEYPLDWAWISYALACDGVKENPFLNEMIEKASKWAVNEQAWAYDRNLGAMGIYSYILRHMEKKEWQKIAEKTSIKIESLCKKEVHKFSFFNNPEFVYASVIGIFPCLSNSLKNFIRKHCLVGIESGNLKRRILFAATLKKLNKEEIQKNVLPSKIESLRIDEIIPALWFAEKYKDSLNYGKAVSVLWKMLSVVRDGMAFEPLQTDTTNVEYVLSPIDIAMLYEAISIETQKPDPIVLFDNYLLHSRIRRISRSLFINKEYCDAVFEATKALNNFVKKATGLQESERKLMQQAIGGKNPLIKFSALDPKSPEYKSQENLQEGMRLIAEGVFAAFRHPKGHEPKNKVQINPYEALDQLVIISYLMNQIELAIKTQKEK